MEREGESKQNAELYLDFVQPIPKVPEGIDVTYGEGDAWTAGTPEQQEELHALLNKGMYRKQPDLDILEFPPLASHTTR